MFLSMGSVLWFIFWASQVSPSSELPSLSGDVLYLRGFPQNAVYEYARRTREWCVCIVRVDGGAIGSEGFNRTRCANPQGGRERV